MIERHKRIVALFGVTLIVGTLLTPAVVGATGETTQTVEYSRDTITQEKYGYDFDEVSQRTRINIEDIYDRQPWTAGGPTDVLTRHQLAQHAYGMEFEALSFETRQELEREYDHQFADAACDREYTRDEIAQHKYGYVFAELSVDTQLGVERLYDRQPWGADTTLESVMTRDEFAQERYDIKEFEDLSQDTQWEVEHAYDAQFAARDCGGETPTDPTTPTNNTTNESGAPYFEVSELTAPTVEQGESATINATITNTGDAPGEQSITLTVEGESTNGTSQLDIVFAFDDTSSMTDEIAAMKRSVQSFAQTVDDSGVDAQYGLVTFKDEVEVDQELTSDVTTLQTSVDALSATGGGDEPEDSFDATLAALDLDRRAGATTVIVLITDAPSHHAGDGSGVSDATRESVATAVDDAGASLIAVARPSSNVNSPGSVQGLATQDVADGEFIDITDGEFGNLLEGEIATEVIKRSSARTVALDAGESTDVSYQVDTTDIPPGEYTVTVASENDSETTTLVVTEPTATPGNETTTGNETTAPTNGTKTNGTESGTATSLDCSTDFTRNYFVGEVNSVTTSGDTTVVSYDVTAGTAGSAGTEENQPTAVEILDSDGTVVASETYNTSLIPGEGFVYDREVNTADLPDGEYTARVRTCQNSANQTFTLDRTSGPAGNETSNGSESGTTTGTPLSCSSDFNRSYTVNDIDSVTTESNTSGTELTTVTYDVSAGPNGTAGTEETQPTTVEIINSDGDVVRTGEFNTSLIPGSGFVYDRTLVTDDLPAGEYTARVRTCTNSVNATFTLEEVDVAVGSLDATYLAGDDVVNFNVAIDNTGDIDGNVPVTYELVDDSGTVVASEETTVSVDPDKQYLHDFPLDVSSVSDGEYTARVLVRNETRTDSVTIGGSGSSAGNLAACTGDYEVSLGVNTERPPEYRPGPLYDSIANDSGEVDVGVEFPADLPADWNISDSEEQPVRIAVVDGDGTVLGATNLTVTVENELLDYGTVIVETGALEADGNYTVVATTCAGQDVDPVEFPQGDNDGDGAPTSLNGVPTSAGLVAASITLVGLFARRN